MLGVDLARRVRPGRSGNARGACTRRHATAAEAGFPEAVVTLELRDPWETAALAAAAAEAVGWLRILNRNYSQFAFDLAEG